MKTQTCHDCGIKEGQLHLEGCDMERCPKCKGQLLSCGCKNINELEREPFFDSGFSCLRCGKFLPELKQVSDQEWKTIIGITYPTDCVLCWNCMNLIKKLRMLLSKNTTLKVSKLKSNTNQ